MADAIEMAAGEHYTLRLPGLGTAGYAWTYRIDGEAGVVRVSVAPAPIDERTALRAGASVDELVTVSALATGRVRVSLAQRRSWEPEDRSVAHRTLDVHVH
jgi:predicted secreted protein